eukprot:1531671-Pyramimonas_sp.AAC.1
MTVRPPHSDPERGLFGSRVGRELVTGCVAGSPLGGNAKKPAAGAENYGLYLERGLGRRWVAGGSR